MATPFQTMRTCTVSGPQAVDDDLVHQAAARKLFAAAATASPGAHSSRICRPAWRRGSALLRVKRLRGWRLLLLAAGTSPRPAGSSRKAASQLARSSSAVTRRLSRSAWLNCRSADRLGARRRSICCCRAPPHVLVLLLQGRHGPSIQGPVPPGPARRRRRRRRRRRSGRRAGTGRRAPGCTAAAGNCRYNGCRLSCTARPSCARTPHPVDPGRGVRPSRPGARRVSCCDRTRCGLSRIIPWIVTKVSQLI